MPAYTPPGGSSTELQARNSVGLFQGITASSWDGTTLTVPRTVISGHSAFGASASINGAGWAAGRYAESGMLFKESITTTAGGGTQAQGLAVAVRLDLAAHATISYIGSESYLETLSTNNKNYTLNFAGVNYCRHLGSGTVGSQYASTHNSEVASTAGVVTHNYGGEHVANGGLNAYGSTSFVTISSDYGSQTTAGTAYGYYANLNIARTNATGADKSYGQYLTITRGATSGGGTASIYGTWSSLLYTTGTTAYDFFASEHVAGLSAGPNYFLWFDSPGVYRIKNDGVTAYYNPAFAKYTPGAANYERIVQQWSSNVAQIGTEAGGTGTLRSLQLLGSHVAIGGSTAAGELRILEPSGSGTNYVSLISPARAADLKLTFPSGLPTANQVLEAASVSGSDVTLGWATAGSGSVATDTIWDAKGDLAVGTGANTASRLAVGANGTILSADSAEATGLKWISAPGGGDMLLGTVQVVTALKTFGAAGAVSKFALAGNTSGSTVLDASAVASGTLTLPAATDTLVGRATTDTLTNKTYDTAGAGNSFAINGVAATANTGTGAVVRATSPTLVAPVLGVASATQIDIGNAGLKLWDTNTSHLLTIAPGSDLTANRTLTLATGDADRTLTLNASTTLGGGTHSGTNTGDQTITLTSDVTGSGTGSFATTIAAGAVTLAKMANLAQDQFIGRTTASTGVPETATITAAARTVLDDASVSAMVDTLGGASSTGSGGLVRTTSATLVSPALGTPTSGTLTNCTGLPVAGISGLGTNVDTFLGTPSSANLANCVTGETGTGALVFATSPEFAGRMKTVATYQEWVDDVDGATITFDLAAGNMHRVTMAGNRTLALSNATAGAQAFTLRLQQDATGTRIPVWFTTIKWAGGSAPTLTTTANKADVFGFIRTGANTYDGFVVGQNL